MSPDRTRRSRSVVLVVEDDPAARELYRQALTIAGYAVFAVEDGLDALKYVESRTPAAVVLDLGLPRLHGTDVRREMAAHAVTADIPVVVVTGEPAPINIPDVACVLRKPINADTLVEAVERCLAGRAMSRVKRLVRTQTE